MSTLVAVDGVVYDLETSPDSPDTVSPLVGEPPRDDEDQVPEPVAPADARSDAP
ncbi:MAG TPA: hypothetical protein VFI53_13520 [Myxococcaceae bacterium]|nr:hypothetical protein [Myxococcaceae bacterium]